MNIREAIIKIVENGQNFEVYSKICAVTAIDKDLNVCDVKPLDGDAEILEVKLTATEGNKDGFIIYPKIESSVIVTFLDKDTAFVSMCTEIDEFIFNGGKNGGLININTLIDELNKNNDILKAIIQGFSTFIPVPNDGGAALKTTMSSLLSPLNVGDFANMEDKKIKH